MTIPQDPWSDFRPLTAARIALGRSGGSVPTRELLDFDLAHARARDAVLMPFDAESIQDEIGEHFGAVLLLIVLGDRPGLGSPDSLGAYFVYGPKAGRTDADRNCVSNIRPAGLPPATAVVTLLHLLTAARHRKLSGIDLKDERSLANVRHAGLHQTPCDLG